MTEYSCYGIIIVKLRRFFIDITIFGLKNPWRTGKMLTPPAIRRNLLESLLCSTDEPQVSILLGARATGKTTLLYHLVENLISQVKLAPEDIYYFDLDTMRCEDVLESNTSLLRFIGTGSHRKFVIIDEIQRLPEPGLFLKSVYDLHLPIKLIATGSSSLEMRSRIKESLAGRRITFYLWPVGPWEWEEFTAQDVWREERPYLRWGGYPQVVMEPDPVKKSGYIVEIQRAYLDRDIETFLRVERIDAFQSLARLLSRQIGQLVNLNEISNTLQISYDTAARYLRYLQETFVTLVVRPFFRNIRSELTKMPKVYFADLGWRNLLAGAIDVPWESMDIGPIYENFVAIALQRFVPESAVHFWRTEGKAEVDFIIEFKGNLIAIEVKAGSMKKASFPSGLRSFIKIYHPAVALVLNSDFDAESLVEGVPVRFVPSKNWLQVLSEVFK